MMILIETPRYIVPLVLRREYSVARPGHGDGSLTVLPQDPVQSGCIGCVRAAKVHLLRKLGSGFFLRISLIDQAIVAVAVGGGKRFLISCSCE